jgi:hypothetical protein
VQAVRFLPPIPRVLALLSAAPQYLPRAPFPYFGEDDTSIYVGAIRTFLPGVYPFNFCPNDPRIIVVLPRGTVQPLFLHASDTLSTNAEPPGFKVWDWLTNEAYIQPKPPRRSSVTRAMMTSQCKTEQAQILVGR